MESIQTILKTTQCQTNKLSVLEIYSLKDDEYYDKENDTIKCKKCDGQRVTDFEVFGKRQRCICECEAEEIKKREEFERQQEKLRELEKMKKSSLIGSRYKDITFESTNKSDETFNEAYKRCKKYCEIYKDALVKGYGLYIYGASGTGKTHLTACMCNELISNNQQCLFTNFFEISKSIRATFSNSSDTESRMIERIANVDFLFIDDLGTELVRKNGEDNWLQEKVFEIINKRYNNLKPTIFTSNYSLYELIKNRGFMAKTVDRINEMATVKLEIKGNSKRVNVDIPF